MKSVDAALQGRNNFDLIRLLAAIGVVFSHSYPATLGSNRKEVFNVLTHGQITLGELCVDIFFVISGFLITQSFFRTKSLTEYFVNRLLRIIPALGVVTVLMCLLIGPIVSTTRWQDYWTSYYTFRYFGNVALYPVAQILPGVFVEKIYPIVTNGSIWTLCYEFTCYIFVAAFGLFFRKSWWVASAIFSIAAATIFLTYISPRSFVEFFCFFASGGLFYVLRRFIALDIRLFLLALGMIAAAVLGRSWLTACLATFGAYALFYVAFSDIFPANVATRYGDLSYGVYLFGWPVQQLMTAVALTPLSNFLASIPIVLVCAALSWKLVERPSLTKKHAVAAWVANAHIKMRRALLPKMARLLGYPHE